MSMSEYSRGIERDGKKKPGSHWLELPLPRLAGKSAKMQTIFGCSLSSKQIALGAKGGHTWAGNSSLSFILFVCVKFPLCPHPFSHPVPCFVHPSIPSLCQCWLHPSSHNHIVAIARPRGTSPPPKCLQPPPAPRLRSADRGPSRLLVVFYCTDQQKH